MLRMRTHTSVYSLPDRRRWRLMRLTAVSVVIMYSEVFGPPHIDRVGTTGCSFLWKNLCNSIYDLRLS